ncbi:MAG: flagellar hook-basal body protein [Bacteroidota bacterium]
MLQRLRNAAASMGELAQRQDRVANNLANANTVGFRRDRAFAEALDERIDVEGSPVSTRVAGQFADVTGGAVVETGNPLDLALQGDGFFALQGADGQRRYTRAGAFVLDADGVVRSPQGHALLGADDAPVTLPPAGGEIAITTTGEIRMAGTPVGQVQVVRVAAPEALERLDGATFAADGVAAEALEPGEIRVRQGMLESSNVDAVAEMSDLIAHVRLFETQQKSLTTTDSILGAATRDLGSF